MNHQLELMAKHGTEHGTDSHNAPPNSAMLMLSGFHEPASSPNKQASSDI